MIRKMDYINSRFTQIINEYFMAGFTVYTQTMSGSQGERAKVDVTDGKNIYRIMLKDDNKHDMEYRYNYFDTREITVEKFDMDNGYGTLWNGRGEIIYSEVFYKVNFNRRNEVFTESLDEIREIEKKHFDRYGRDDVSTITTIPVEKMADKEKIRDICRRHKGYKSIRRIQIKAIEKSVGAYDTCYKVIFVDGVNKANLVIKRVRNELRTLATR